MGQLRALGFSAAGVSHRVAAGRLHALHAGVYALGRPDLPAEGRWMAAVLACGPGTLLSHLSCAALHGLRSTAGATIDVTVPRRVGLARPGLCVHRSTWLPDSDRTVVRGVPCTSVARTLLDLSAEVHGRVFGEGLERAEVLRVLDWSAITELLSRARGRAGVRMLRQKLGAANVERGVPREELERRFLTICRRAGVPHPTVNQWLTVAGEEIQVDLLWRVKQMIVETDGYSTHRTRQAFRRDRWRDQLLLVAGWRVVRFTWDQVTKEPEDVTAVLRRLISR